MAMINLEFGDNPADWEDFRNLISMKLKRYSLLKRCITSKHI
jgi:hypothetical protein